MEASARLRRIDDQLEELGAVIRALGSGLPRDRVTGPGTFSSPRPPRVETAEVDAGPFVTLGAVQDLHDQLTALPAVEDVALRGFSGDRALLDVTLR